MLRECRRILKPGGRMGCYTIHVAPGLSESDYARALELGPTEVAAELDAVPMLKQAGFVQIEQTDVTGVFVESCRKYLDVRTRHADGLRAVEGEEDFQDEQDKMQRFIEAAGAGLLKRSFLLAAAPLGQR